jgi:hypothetical protein
VSPHSQLLIAAATVGGAIVLAVGMMLGNPYGLPTDLGGADQTPARVTVLDAEIRPEGDNPPSDGVPTR